MMNLNSNNNNNGNTNSQASGQRSAVEDITNRLDQMNVDMVDVSMDTNQLDHGPASELEGRGLTNPRHSVDSIDPEDAEYYDTCSALMEQDESIAMKNSQSQQRQQHQQSDSNILIVTNVDPNVFKDNLMQEKFESLFRAIDNHVTFRYLKSFRRVRLDFTSSIGAEEARLNLNHCLLGNTKFKCYLAQIIKPNYLAANSNENGNGYTNSMHLNIPKLTKQFLISPPASPPVGWEPVNESSPCIDVQLLSAIANLVPGKVHEIHAGNDSQPGIYVEVCEEPQFESSQSSIRTCSKIPRTMSPAAYCQSSS